MQSRGVFRASAVRMAGGGGVTPRWNLPPAEYHKYTYQPSIPDKHYNVAHNNYAPITMWLRARRPYMERVLYAMYDTVSSMAGFVYNPLRDTVNQHLPGFGFKVMGLFGFLLGYNYMISGYIDRTDSYMTLEKLKVHAATKKLWDAGFFSSESEVQDEKVQSYNEDAFALDAEFSSLLDQATQQRSFGVFVSALSPEKVGAKAIREPLSWRFNMMPYGRDNVDAKAFSDNGIDSPAGSFPAFPSLDVGSSGDYCARVDNKPNPIRKARHLYTSAYIPPTK